MKAQEVRRKILEFIDRLQGSSSNYIGDATIAKELKLTVEEVQGHLGILEDEGRVMLSTSFEGSAAFLNPQQRQVFREESEVDHNESLLKVTSYDLFIPEHLRILTGLPALAGKIDWQRFGNIPPDECEGIRVHFPLSGRIERRRALQIVENRLQQNGIDFLVRRSQAWRLDFDGLRKQVPDLVKGLDWAIGVAVLEPEIEIKPSTSGEQTIVRYSVYREEYILEKQQKIFLSHKGATNP